MLKTIYLVIGVVLALGIFGLVLHNNDRRAVEESILLVINADASTLSNVEQSHAKARSKALSIRFRDMRSRALAEIEGIYQERKAILKQAEQLKREALALMGRQHGDLWGLRDSRLRAEEIASRIRIGREAAEVRALVAKTFKDQSEFIAAEERRRAEEEVRRLEAERRAQEEQRRAAEAAAETERQRIAAAQYAQQQQQTRRVVVEYSYICDCTCCGIVFNNPKRYRVTAISTSEAALTAYEYYGKGSEHNRYCLFGSCPDCTCRID